MYLHHWLADKRMTKKAFAQLIDSSSGHLCNYLAKRNKVSRKMARQIERATQGQVTVQEVLDFNPPMSYNAKNNKNKVEE